MKIGVLGTGMVGHAIASKLVALGHEVMMGSRTSDNPKAQTWAKTARGTGRVGTFAETSVFGDMVFNCTQGTGSLAALQAAGAANLDGKILVDVANVLTRESPGLESLGEQIQKAFPQAKVVKTLNTINCELMVAPERLSGAHSVFLSGNDTGAKERVRDLLGSFGTDRTSVEQRWVSIPPSTWHRLLGGSEAWGMLSFHTVTPDALIEERPVDTNDLDGQTRQERYTDRR